MQELLQQIPVPPIWQQAIGFLGIIIATFIAATVVRYLLFVLIGRLTRRTKGELDDDILAAIRKPVFYLVILYGMRSLFEFT
ncbi:MAG: hypothetical protein V3T31_12735, partial [candidate division Zixibacteria bacterium]